MAEVRHAGQDVPIEGRATNLEIGTELAWSPHYTRLQFR